MSLVLSASFIDLYLGESFYDVRGLDGATATRVPAPETWHEELNALRASCHASFEEHGEPEFSVMFHDQLLRVTRMVDIRLSNVYFIRRPSASIRSFEDLGLADYVVNEWRRPSLRGLVLVAGEMAHGKTSTAYGMIVDRMIRHGGLTIAIEDPAESMLTGEHGLGRVVQVQATRKSGGYAQQLYHAMRTGAELIFLGEIRDKATAAEAVTAGINGQLILGTLHAGSPVQAIERIITLASGQLDNAAEILAGGLCMVIWQHLERTRNAQGKTVARLVAKPLVLSGQDAAAIREKIRTNNTRAVMQEIEQQINSAQWD